MIRERAEIEILEGLKSIGAAYEQLNRVRLLTERLSDAEYIVLEDVTRDLKRIYGRLAYMAQW
jgi:hypothetical protein